MQLKETLVNTALIGTGKKPLQLNELPDALQASAAMIAESKADEETKFLSTTAAALNYYRAGVQPVQFSLPANA
ncbi:MAG TPA: hypothetical protein VK154_17710, partial [Chitinophagales bacterium]|nr:hypothetical protein [Chitinophagales bacterium]